ncbi:hypothetical protein [Ligilactobacillus agilis]|uniref:hypothetical protein n=1 Tax=Ligilactobacillus agilis TaxID=1601 RepID=UPI001CDB7C34|nr:hypothetical protein [Ligilactobacillus agilis]
MVQIPAIIMNIYQALIMIMILTIAAINVALPIIIFMFRREIKDRTVNYPVADDLLSTK